MYENKHGLVFGYDPEVFLSYKDNKDYDKFLGDSFVMSPATLATDHGLKFVKEDSKHPVLLVGEGYKFIMDGVATELNTNAPFNNPVDMYDTVNRAMDDLSKFALNFGLEVYKRPVINFDYKRWWGKGIKKDSLLYQGVIFGCDADEDAFNTEWTAYILDVANHPYRYGGGHFHFSGCTEIEQYPLPLVRLLAITQGNYCIANSPFVKEERLRGKYYGKPGKYRIQRYSSGTVGLEYRTPSNAWVSYDYTTFERMFACIDKAIDFVKDRVTGRRVLDEFSDKTIDAIRTADRKLANSVLSELGLL